MFRSIIAATLVIAAPATAQTAKKDAAEKSADNRDKVICKRFVKTGSLVDGYRACKTKWEWERERDNLRQNSSAASCRLSGQGGSCG